MNVGAGDASLETVSAGAAARLAGASPVRGVRRRPRPPRRPRRLRFLSNGSPGAVTSPSGEVAVSGTAVSSASCSGCSAADSSGSEVLCESVGTEEVSSSGLASAVLVVDALAGSGGGMGAPRRVKASSALVRHCARRKRSAAAVYHFAASACSPAFSWNCASSNATMASRVRSYSSASFTGASVAPFALRMRA